MDDLGRKSPYSKYINQTFVEINCSQCGNKFKVSKSKTFFEGQNTFLCEICENTVVNPDFAFPMRKENWIGIDPKDIYHEPNPSKKKRIVPKPDFVSIDRPSWTNYFLGLAFLVSERSEDPDTHHGTILTDRHNHIIGTGYNSLPRGISKGLIANTRPKKYERMIHSEENALLNKTLDPWLIPSGAVAYITGKPCLRCLDRLWNAHVTTLFCADIGYSFQECEKERAAFNEFVADTGIEINFIRPEFEWIRRRMDQYKTLPVI